MIELISPLELKADPDNPRATDLGRLELVRLSLQKFGFLLPLYVDCEGQLLSGHQRATAAGQLGWLVPVVRRQQAERDPHGVNLTFNRATNDFRLTDIDHTALPVEELRHRLLGHPDAVEPHPCLYPMMRNVRDLVTRNVDRFERYAANAARQLGTYGIRMPIVIASDGEVLNGIGRLQEASARNEREIECVILDQATDAELARVTLNRLSMDFSFSERFKDVLRNNSYRRARQRRRSLGSGYLFTFGVKRCRDFSPGRHRAELQALFGARVLDFGAGQGDEARMLRKIGVKVTTFEPYRSYGRKPCVADGRRSAHSFLRSIAEGRQFSSIMLSSVLNSIPFAADREHVVTLCAALAAPHTTLFAAARSVKDPNWKECSTGIGLGETSARSARFVLHDEPGLAVSELNAAPKIQKYFQPSEFQPLFEKRFADVEIGEHINNLTAVCRQPRPVEPHALRSAIEFEFDLPYPNGRMGLVDKAIAVFEARLGGAPVTDWTFNGFEKAFDAHVREQLPWYELASDAAALIARHYIPKGGLVYDIGCSTGNVGRSLARVLDERRAKLVALDECPDMVKAYQAPGIAICVDAASYDYEPFDVAILFLTLMFLPVSDRLRLLARLRANLKPGGSIIVFDKSVTAPGYEGTVFARLTWHNKLQSGATPHDVTDKEMKLIGVQRPIDRREIDPAIEVFRFADFGGWIITPEIIPNTPA